MFDKTLASIYFLPDKLLVTEISSNRKKVLRHASVDLPPDLIKDYKVFDTNSLSKIIQSVWQKFGFRNKTVGIVLPEFSTFTKFLTVPRIQPAELSEAINWQAQEFLPSSPEDIVMDWKVVEKNDKGYGILLVAVAKDLLIGYVEAVEKTGLFPLVVETPSIGLVRLSQSREDTLLTIYKNFGETLLVISQREKIIGTSVLNKESREDTARTVSRMIKHYKDYPVKLALGAGSEFTKGLKDSLAQSLKLPTENVNIDIKGLNAEKIQEYLIPLSILIEAPLEPSDPKSLNLLPTYLVEKYKKERLKIQIWGLTLLITLLVWIPFLIVIGTYLFLDQRVNDLGQEISGSYEVIERRQKAIKDVQTINIISQKILNIKKEFTLSQEVFNGIYKAKPDGLIIEKYDLDLDKGVINLKGIASTRNSLLNFKNNLEGNSDFIEIAIPISSFEGEVDLEYEIVFSYKPIYKEEIPKLKIESDIESERDSL